MRITDEHLYHGAALNQIADNKRFTAINAFIIKKKKSKSAFRINDDIGIYIKYATTLNSVGEYSFTFTKEHLNELKELHEKCERVFLALVCVKNKKVCCLPYSTFKSIIKTRRINAKKRKDWHTILATLKERGRFRVHINASGERGKMLKEQIIPRNDFPKKYSTLTNRNSA